MNAAVKVLRKLGAIVLWVGLVGWWLNLVIVNYMATMVTKPGNRNGLGMELVPAPTLVQWWLDTPSMWPGWEWVIVNGLFLLGSIVVSPLVVVLIKWLWGEEPGTADVPPPPR